MYLRDVKKAGRIFSFRPEIQQIRDPQLFTAAEGGKYIFRMEGQIVEFQNNNIAKSRGSEMFNEKRCH